MSVTKNLAIAATALTLVLGFAGSASAETAWERNHPRRDEVIDRLQHQNHRIREERREGELTAGQAYWLHREDRAIFRQEQFDARWHHGHITKREQRRLNGEENRVSHQIGR